jgi:hypothetical protein
MELPGGSQERVMTSLEIAGTLIGLIAAGVVVSEIRQAWRRYRDGSR